MPEPSGRAAIRPSASGTPDMDLGAPAFGIAVDDPGELPSPGERGVRPGQPPHPVEAAEPERGHAIDRVLGLVRSWRRHATLLVVLIAIAQAGDLVTTLVGIARYGFRVEQSGVVVALWVTGGLWLVAISKAFVVAACALLVRVEDWFDDDPTPVRLAIAVMVAGLLAYGLLSGLFLSARNAIELATTAAR